MHTLNNVLLHEAYLQHVFLLHMMLFSIVFKVHVTLNVVATTIW